MVLVIWFPSTSASWKNYGQVRCVKLESGPWNWNRGQLEFDLTHSKPVCYMSSGRTGSFQRRKRLVETDLTGNGDRNSWRHSGKGNQAGRHVTVYHMIWATKHTHCVIWYGFSKFIEPLNNIGYKRVYTTIWYDSMNSVNVHGHWPRTTSLPMIIHCWWLFMHCCQWLFIHRCWWLFVHCCQWLFTASDSSSIAANYYLSITASDYWWIIADGYLSIADDDYCF